jgi:hypothetical protein
MNQEHRLENTFFFFVENTLATRIVLPDSVKNIKNRADIGHL